MSINQSIQILLLTSGIGLLVSSCTSENRTNYLAVVEELELSELAATFDTDKTARFVSESPDGTTKEEQQAAALLNSLDLTGSHQEILARWQKHPIKRFLDTTDEPVWLTEDAATIDAFADKLKESIEHGISTGYNIMPVNRWPTFDPSKTIIYGHNDLKHARQLYALCYSEGLRPQVSFLNKSSAFVFRDDWGEPSVPLIQLKNGDRLVTALEFDLCIEFESKGDIDRFYELVTRYAKKDTPDEPGLIYDAWWQPFYRTFQPSSFGKELTVQLVSFQGYRTNLMSLPKDAEEKLKKLRAMDTEWSVEPIRIWVNPAFYRFQLGDYR